MKKDRFFGLAGMVGLVLTFVFVLAVGMTFVGCDNSTNGDTDLFTGTWVSIVSDGVNRKIIMKNDGTWEFHQSDSGDTAMDTRGTYTYTGMKATAIASEIYMEGQWMSTSGQPTEMITVTAEIQTDGTLKVTAYDGTFTYTKQ